MEKEKKGRLEAQFHLIPEPSKSIRTQTFVFRSSADSRSDWEVKPALPSENESPGGRKTDIKTETETTLGSEETSSTSEIARLQFTDKQRNKERLKMKASKKLVVSLAALVGFIFIAMTGSALAGPVQYTSVLRSGFSDSWHGNTSNNGLPVCAQDNRIFVQVAPGFFLPNVLLSLIHI